KHHSYHPRPTHTHYNQRESPPRNYYKGKTNERIESKPSIKNHLRSNISNMRTPIQTEKRAKSDEFLTAQSKFRYNSRRISDIHTHNRFDPLTKTSEEEDFWSLRNKDKHKFLSRQKSPNKRQSTEEGELEEEWTHREGKRDKRNP
ncbi:Hypothetical predicted protein, partial [Pelobates cultripes]